MFLLFSYCFTSKQELQEHLLHWVSWTRVYLMLWNLKHVRRKQSRNISHCCAGRRESDGCSVQYTTLSKSQGGSEVNVSLLALLAGMIKRELALLLFGTIGSYSLGNPEPLAVMLEFGVEIVCPATCQSECCTCSLTSTFTRDKDVCFGSRWILCGLFLICVGFFSSKPFLRIFMWAAAEKF